MIRLPPVFLPHGIWGELAQVMKAMAATKFAEALRLSLYYAAHKVAGATAQEIKRWAEETAELYAQQPPKGWAQVGRLREVAVTLHSTYPLRKVKRELSAVLGREVPRAFALAFAVHVAASSRRQPPERVLALLRSAWAEAQRKSTSADLARHLAQEMTARRPLVPEWWRDEWDSLIAKLSSPEGVEEVAKIIGAVPPKRARPAPSASPSVFRDILASAWRAAGGDPRRLEQEVLLRSRLLKKNAKTPEEAAAAELLTRLSGDELVEYAAHLLGLRR